MNDMSFTAGMALIFAAASVVYLGLAAVLPSPELLVKSAAIFLVVALVLATCDDIEMTRKFALRITDEPAPWERR